MHLPTPSGKNCIWQFREEDRLGKAPSRARLFSRAGKAKSLDLKKPLTNASSLIFRINSFDPVFFPVAPLTSAPILSQ